MQVGARHRPWKKAGAKDDGRTAPESLLAKLPYNSRTSLRARCEGFNPRSILGPEMILYWAIV